MAKVITQAMEANKTFSFDLRCPARHIIAEQQDEKLAATEATLTLRIHICQVCWNFVVALVVWVTSQVHSGWLLSKYIWNVHNLSNVSQLCHIELLFI